MFRTLFEQGINIELISTSDIRITCIVAARRWATPCAPSTRRSPSTSRQATPDPARRIRRPGANGSAESGWALRLRASGYSQS